MFVDVESVGAQKARECRNKAWHMLIGAAWALGAVAVLLLAVAYGMSAKSWPPLFGTPPLTPQKLAAAKPTCTHVDSKQCFGGRVIICQTTINGRKVYSSEAC